MNRLPTIRRNEFWGAVLALIGTLLFCAELVAVSAMVQP